jgi:hypothetical protein
MPRQSHINRDCRVHPTKPHGARSPIQSLPDHLASIGAQGASGTSRAMRPGALNAMYK